MKMILRFLLPSLFVITLCSFSMIPDAIPLSRDEQPRVEVVFTRAMNFNDLVRIQTELAQKGIALDYRKLEFDDEGKLLALHFLVDCGDGFKGAAQRPLTYKGRFGFYRDYSRDAATPFAAGNL